MPDMRFRLKKLREAVITYDLIMVLRKLMVHR